MSSHAFFLCLFLSVVFCSVEPADLEGIKSRLHNVPEWGDKPWIYQEVISSYKVDPSAYFGIGAVSEFNWGAKVGEKYNNGKPGELIRLVI